MLTNRRSEKSRKMNSKLLLCFIFLICIVTTIFIALNNQVEQKSYLPFATGSRKVSINEEKWYLTLVNRWNPIATNYTIETTKLSNGKRVDKRIYPYLQEMFDAAISEGVYPIVASGYRTGKEQKEIYNNKIAAYKAEGFSNREAKEEAEFWVAIPGTSEHELGLSVDINADGINSVGTEVYDWLKNNAHLYGFINRYPSGKTEITGVFHEPWHYRYVGVEAATEIYNQGICLEEYLGEVK